MIRSAAAMMALLVCGVTTAATINVPGDYATIQAAVDAASGGDEIIVAPGTYTGSDDEVVDTLGDAIGMEAGPSDLSSLLFSQSSGTVQAVLKPADSPAFESVQLRPWSVLTPTARIEVIGRDGSRPARLDGFRQWRADIPQGTLLLTCDQKGVRGLTVRKGVMRPVELAGGQLLEGTMAIGEESRVPCSGLAAPEAPHSNDRRAHSPRSACLIPLRIAFESDWEFTNNLFAGDADDAAAYVVELAAAISVIQEEELGLAIEVTYVRTWSSDIDPYDPTEPVDDLLNQFRDEWEANEPESDRHVGHLLSGSHAPASTGLAWRGSACSSFGYAYSSALQGFFTDPPPDHSWSTWDVLIVAHETGHTIGAEHTHEMVPPIDECGNGDCTNAWGGTIMSFCHTCQPNGSRNIVLDFHPRVQADIESFLGSINPADCDLGIPGSDTDSDGDGTADCNDGCPYDPNKVDPGICGCGVADTDSDGDGTADCNDGCPADPNKIDPGQCGCGAPDTDSDGDGTADCNDGCPYDPNKVDPGICGCGVADTDSDGDGTADCNDGCPADPNKIDPGQCGCGAPDTDSDGDGTADCNDGCPYDPNKVDPGICGCGVADTDSDGDGTADCNDACPNDPDNDIDGDGVCGDVDAFPNDPTEWLDSDNDGIGDNADPCPFWSGSCDNDGSTLYVTTGESINDAIYGVPHEGVVQIMPGTHLIDSPIDLQGRALTLRAGGVTGSVIIDGQGVSAGIQCVSGETSHTLIYGLTIQNCGGTTGAGMLCDGSSPNIVMCIFTGNTASQGGGIACRNGAAPSLIDCEITGNDASGSDGGGVWVSSAEITMIACDVSANTADDDGGGIYLYYATANLHEINVAGNTADYGGGLFGYASTVTMTNAIVENNFAAGDGSNATDGGGGISMDGGDWVIDGCLIQDNFSLANAGGLLSNQAAVTLDHSTVRGNTASTLAGGVYSQGSMYVANTAICSNTPSQIIGAHVDGGGNSISILCQANSAACCLPLENMCLLAEEPDCTYLGGQWLGEGTTCVGDPCDIAPPICPADIDHNQTIDTSDLLLVLYAWGGQSDSADVNGDGLVSVMDLLEVLSQWGPCE